MDDALAEGLDHGNSGVTPPPSWSRRRRRGGITVVLDPETACAVESTDRRAALTLLERH